MGVIKGQSIRYSIFNALAIVLGALAILFIIPFDKTSYGIVNMLFAAAYLCSPIIGLGLPLVIIKFYPQFSREENEASYLSFALTLTIAVTSLLGFLLTLFYGEFVSLASYFKLNAEFLNGHKYTIILLAVLLVFNYVIISFSSLYKKIAIPELLSNVAYKVVVPLMVLFVYWGVVPEEYLGIGLILFYIISTAAILGYVYSLRTWKWSLSKSWLDKKRVTALFSFLVQSGIQTLANGLILRLDILMVGLVLGSYQAGIYGIILFMTSTLEIASKAISQISAPIIAQKWSEGNIAEIEKIYAKSAVVLTVISCFLFLLLYYNFPYIFEIMPNTEYDSDWRLVMVILSIARIIDLGFSLNGVILTYSRLMKANIVLLILSGILYFILLVNLLPLWGMAGAAISYLAIILFFNIAKHVLIKIVWKLDPISFNLFKVILITAISFGINWVLPPFRNPFVGVILNSLFIGISYLGLLLLTKPSDDIEQLLKNSKARLIAMKNRAST